MIPVDRDDPGARAARPREPLQVCEDNRHVCGFAPRLGDRELGAPLVIAPPALPQAGVGLPFDRFQMRRCFGALTQGQGCRPRKQRKANQSR
jgi:hypothetical protein